MFLFNPKVVIIDFSKALRNALTTENLFNYYELFNKTFKKIEKK
jgi:hypothetical protein